ncbi:MAG: C-GCAxxG-C-C family protein [Oscillospiraceae bacterium]
MAEMKLYELVNHYHIGTELTCAEAMFMACNEYYHLNLSEETRKMFSVMGLGMQTEQSCCGAFTVAVGIIGLMTAKEGQTDVNNMEGYRMIAELTDFMLGFYGTLHCVELQRLEIVGYENPCHAIVEALAKNWRSCWRAAASYARQMQDRLAPDLWQKKQEVMNMSIELSRDELLVLYDLLHRLEDVEEIFEDPSEQEVLWHIQTQLEKELVEPFQADYQAIIEEARRAVTEQY